MMCDILQAVLAVFSMIGIITAIYFLLLGLLSIRRVKKELVLLLPPEMGRGDAECMIRGAHLRARLIGVPLLAVDCGLEPEARDAAERTCAELEKTRLCAVNAVAEDFLGQITDKDNA